MSQKTLKDSVHDIDSLDQKSIKFFNETMKRKLKNSGFKIRVEHFRHFNDDEHKSNKLVSIREKENLASALPKGGLTKLSLKKDGADEHQELVFTSSCSKKDIFCRRKGVFVCLVRALEKLVIS